MWLRRPALAASSSRRARTGARPVLARRGSAGVLTEHPVTTRAAARISRSSSSAWDSEAAGSYATPSCRGHSRWRSSSDSGVAQPLPLPSSGTRSSEYPSMAWVKGCPTLGIACGCDSASLRVFARAVIGLTFDSTNLAKGSPSHASYLQN